MKEFLKKNTDYIIIGIVSIIAFIVGCLALNVWISFLIIGLADLILFIPNLIKSRKKLEKSRHASTERKKEKKKNLENIIIYFSIIMYCWNFSSLGFLGIHSKKCS